VISRGLTFPVAYGTTREESELIGAWWEGERGFIQPAEFLLVLDFGAKPSSFLYGMLSRGMTNEERGLYVT
jgi:hypothetical protein